jgi:hypothetical protein
MNKKITICSNTSWYLYNFRKGLIKALQSSGYEVTLIAPEDDYTKKSEGDNPYQLDSSRMKTIIISPK